MNGYIINIIIHYLIIFLILFIGMIAYFKIADRYNIIDKPNLRSSHDYITIRGGGIIFWLAGVLYSILNLPDSIFFLTGFTLICGVSFWDDVSSLSNRIRVIIHFIAISLVFYDIGMFHIFPWWLIGCAYILFVGIMNAYNFMDGINGITGLYSLAILISLQYVNYFMINFTYPDLINYSILACMVFLFFNFRKRAKCFAGDVGSIGIAFLIVTLLLQLMIKTYSFCWIMFLAVYGVDSIFTILHRLYLKQNIFKPHRLHFYQILSNECKISHLKVSSAYAVLQLVICAVIIYAFNFGYAENFFLYLFILIPLSIIYLLKFKLIRGHSKQN